MAGVDCQLLRTLSLFERLDHQALNEVANHAALRKLPSGRAVFAQGDLAGEYFVLLSGRLKVTQLTEDGRQVVVRFVIPGELFGIARALSRPDYPGTATAVVASAFLVWPVSFWDTFVETNPSLAVSAMKTVGQRLQESHTRLREMATEEVERRVAHTVLRLAQQSGASEDGGIRIDFPISKQDIAEMAGTTLHTVSRIMSVWQSQGLVRTGRQKLVICDRAGLAALANAVRR